VLEASQEQLAGRTSCFNFVGGMGGRPEPAGDEASSSAQYTLELLTKYHLIPPDTTHPQQLRHHHFLHPHPQDHWYQDHRSPMSGGERGIVNGEEEQFVGYIKHRETGTQLRKGEGSDVRICEPPKLSPSLLHNLVNSHLASEGRVWCLQGCRTWFKTGRGEVHLLRERAWMWAM
jgi:hypothetical protein